MYIIEYVNSHLAEKHFTQLSRHVQKGWALGAQAPALFHEFTVIKGAPLNTT